MKSSLLARCGLQDGTPAYLSPVSCVRAATRISVLCPLSSVLCFGGKGGSSQQNQTYQQVSTSQNQGVSDKGVATFGSGSAIKAGSGTITVADSSSLKAGTDVNLGGTSYGATIKVGDTEGTAARTVADLAASSIQTLKDVAAGAAASIQNTLATASQQSAEALDAQRLSVTDALASAEQIKAADTSTQSKAIFYGAIALMAVGGAYAMRKGK